MSTRDLEWVLVEISGDGSSKQVSIDSWVEGRVWVGGRYSLCEESYLEVRLISRPSLFFEVHTRGFVS